MSHAIIPVRRVGIFQVYKREFRPPEPGVPKYLVRDVEANRDVKNFTNLRKAVRFAESMFKFLSEGGGGQVDGL